MTYEQKEPAWEAVLSPLATKLSLKNRLSKVTLAHILAGDTCTPISLPEFEMFLTYKEHCMEVLHFIVWFNDYRSRYFAKPPPAFSRDRGRLTISCDNLPSSLPAPSPLSSSPEEQSCPDGVSTEAVPFPAPAIISSSLPDSSFPTTPGLESPAMLLKLHHSRSSPEKMPSSADSSTLEPSMEECLRVFATFFNPGASRELNIDQAVRDSIAEKLQSTTHPDIFLPVYNEMYLYLETMTLPRFLIIASTNINLPKQIYWYALGSGEILISLVIPVILIHTTYTPPQASRAWRLFGSLFMLLGVGHLWSGWRGFCSMLFTRGATQLRSWELAAVEDEESHGPRNESGFSLEAVPEQQYQVPWEEPPEDKDITPDARPESSVLHPGTLRKQPVSASPSSTFVTTSEGAWPARRRKPKDIDSEHPRPLKRPPLFGPEKTVLDPHVKQAHIRVYIELWFLTMSFSLVYSAIVLAIPGRSG